MTKGTGIVTSVPSDSPDDFSALNEYRSKPEKHDYWGITAEMVEPFEPVPIMDIPEYGNLIAPKLCKDMKIAGQKDKKKLLEAKDIAYKQGFNNGVFIVGDHAGKKVIDVKDTIKMEMVAKGDACLYFEPENPVVSRTNDDCIVAKVDQWLLGYGEEEWQKFCVDHTTSGNFETYHKETHNQFQHVLGWLKEWGCSRNFGLGTQVPWDEQFVIESLSDSTIYMAFYTIAHLLQGSVNGSVEGALNIPAEQMTVQVFDYIFLGAPYPGDCGIDEQKLKTLRREFEYWYPMDLRCSGKDLIGNHLTFCLYNHAAIWEDKKKMPQGFFCNGWMLLNDMPMSKSKGNFITLRQSINKYSADATRLTLADAGDTLDDGNFKEDNANANIMKLYNLATWMQTEMGKIDFASLNAADAEGSMDIYDKMFENEINRLIVSTKQLMTEMKYKLALRDGFHELLNMRDDYVLMKKGDLNPHLVLRFVEVQLLMMAPFAAHFADYHWRNLFVPAASQVAGAPEYNTTVVSAPWPTPSKEYQTESSRIYKYIKKSKKNFSKMFTDMNKKGKKKKKKAAAAEPPKEFKNCVIFYADNYLEW